MHRPGVGEVGRRHAIGVIGEAVLQRVVVDGQVLRRHAAAPGQAEHGEPRRGADEGREDTDGVGHGALLAVVTH